ncbi:hypothetical protein GO986_11700 [Deinococcus sp. HMF7620]|uniref:Uncharacterized protein n=1 Tax=Deinococcus arboris TaxID=2682977 RepID=A0A7C9HS42_9DEIO|nr:hypothetical protein [Deinococcus arboris]MVN87432.1 hypothetical protein [Deinococcus arboris]
MTLRPLISLTLCVLRVGLMTSAPGFRQPDGQVLAVFTSLQTVLIMWPVPSPTQLYGQPQESDGTQAAHGLASAR